MAKHKSMKHLLKKSIKVILKINLINEKLILIHFPLTLNVVFKWRLILIIIFTNTKRLQKQWIIENMNTKLINKNSIIISDMQPLYLLVAKQTSSTLYATKTRTNPDASYRKLNKISKLQASLKEALVHYHGLGFTNIQNYLNLWKWKYQHKDLTPNQQATVLYFNI